MRLEVAHGPDCFNGNVEYREVRRTGVLLHAYTLADFRLRFELIIRRERRVGLDERVRFSNAFPQQQKENSVLYSVFAK